MAKSGRSSARPHHRGLHQLVMGERWCILGTLGVRGQICWSGVVSDSILHVEAKSPTAVPLLQLASDQEPLLDIG